MNIEAEITKISQKLLAVICIKCNRNQSMAVNDKTKTQVLGHLFKNVGKTTKAGKKFLQKQRKILE